MPFNLGFHPKYILNPLTTYVLQSCKSFVDAFSNFVQNPLSTLLTALTVGLYCNLFLFLQIFVVNQNKKWRSNSRTALYEAFITIRLNLSRKKAEKIKRAYTGNCNCNNFQYGLQNKCKVRKNLKQSFHKRWC